MHDHSALAAAGIGQPLAAAARWVGAACWLETQIGQEISEAMVDVARAPVRTTLWSIRANRNQMAREWYERLPVLRELPRGELVRPLAMPRWGCDTDYWFETLERSRSGGEWLDRMVDLLGFVAADYIAQAEVMVGLADAPAAVTLERATLLARQDQHDLARAAGVKPSSGTERPRLL